MKKRILCLLLSVVMLCGVLASCSKKEEKGPEGDLRAKTVSMYLMSDAAVSPEQEALIEAAVNEITKKKFTTYVDITFLTADDYYRIIEENLAYQKANSGLYIDDESAEQEVEYNEYGLESLKYPVLKQHQMDIFYFSGYGKYHEYYANGYLSLLTEYVDGASKQIKEYVTPVLLQYMKEANNGIFAIPTNRALGDYTYLLLNKEVLEEVYYDPTHPDITGFKALVDENCQDILEYVKKDPDLSQKFVPLYSTTGEVDVLNVHYWGVDDNGFLTDDFSVLGGSYNPAWPYQTLDNFAEMRSVMADSASKSGIGMTFAEQLEVLNAYKYAGYYDDEAVEDPENPKDFAIGYMKGSPEIVAQYSDKYEIVTLATPELHTCDLYENMFGVSAYAVNKDRSMEIVTYLNTNEEFRNLILYGIEGVNYEKIDSGLDDVNGDPYYVIKRLGNYQMDEYKTGNVLLAYPEYDPKAGSNLYAMRNEFGKEQNRELKPSFAMGFQVIYKDMVAYDVELKNLAKASKEIEAELLAMDGLSPTEWSTFINGVAGDKTQKGLKSKIGDVAGPVASQSRKMLGDITDGNFVDPLGSLYLQWLVDKGMYIEETEEEE